MAFWRLTKGWMERHPLWTLTLVTLFCLGPFMAKPFNMDDPLFMWAAQHIVGHPLDPFGFTVNWYGYATPMWAVTQNPVLACYYLAGVGRVFGWSEYSMHLAMLIPALAVVLGTYRLAKRWTPFPLYAALLTLFAPAFLVSATTVMCDVLMLGLWVWAVVFWVEGCEPMSHGKMAAAAVFAALACLTKYFGICVVPLLACYSFMVGWRGRWAFGWLAVPLIVLACYELWVSHLYGRALLFSAAHYARAFEDNRWVVVATTICFMGGCVAPIIFNSLSLWRHPGFWMGGLACVIGVTLAMPSLLPIIDHVSGEARFLLKIQVIAWAFGAGIVIFLLFKEMWHGRNSTTWFLGLWVIGTMIFAAFINWTVNARSIQPLVPALVILAVRATNRARRWILVMSAGLSLSATHADYLFATASRTAALAMDHYFGSRPVWYEGHWGFQYYMNQAGRKPLDYAHPEMQPGDGLVIPANNTNLKRPPGWGDQTNFTGPTFLATMNVTVGAGFYAASSGPLPFVFNLVPPEQVLIYLLNPQKSVSSP